MYIWYIFYAWNLCLFVFHLPFSLYATGELEKFWEARRNAEEEQGGNQNSHFSSWSKILHLSSLSSSKTKRKCSLPSSSQEGVMRRGGVKSGRTEKCFPYKPAAEPGPHYSVCGRREGKPKIETIIDLKVCISFHKLARPCHTFQLISLSRWSRRIFSAPCFWGSKEENDLPKIMACGKLDLDPAFNLLNVYTNNDA